MKMRTISRVSVIALVAIVGAVIVLRARFSTSNNGHRPQALIAGTAFSQPAPNFQLADQDGALMSLGQLRGQVVLLTFVDTTSVADCSATAQMVNAVAGALGNQAQGVDWLAISVHPSDLQATVSQSCVSEHVSVPLHVLTGTQEQLGPVWKAYDIEVDSSAAAMSHTLATYLIDRGGVERELLRQPVSPTDTAQDLRTLLAETR